MNICIITRNHDKRLQFFCECFEYLQIPIRMILSTPSPLPHRNWRWYIRQILHPDRKTSLNTPITTKYPVELVDDHSSKTAYHILNKYKIDVIFLSLTGILKGDILCGPWKIINCHPAILPRYRGKGSCEWAIYENGQLGITAHYVDAGVDTGGIIQHKYFEPLNNETLTAYRNRLDREGAKLMSEIAQKMICGKTLELIPQQRGVLYTRKPLKGEKKYILKAFENRRQGLYK